MKSYNTGDKLHTVATIKKVYKGIPSVLEIEGRRYMLDRETIPYGHNKTLEKVEIPK